MGKEKINITTEERGSLMGDVSRLSSIDSVELFMRTMAEEPLLKAKEEVELAQQIELGRESVDTLSGVRSKEERERLLVVIEEGLQARFKLARANERLVISIAKKYRGVMEMGDLIQEGNLGLMRAVDKYEWRRGNRFSTYATWWIRQAITRGVSQKSRIMRIPLHQVEKLNKIKQIIGEIDRGGEGIDYEEVARMVNERTRDGNVDGLEIKNLLAFDGVISINAKVGGHTKDEFGDGLVDESEAGPVESFEVIERREALGVLLDKLPEKMGMILRLRYGLVDGTPKTLEEVGEIYGLSRERIRQLEGIAMRQLKVLMEGEEAEDWLIE